MQEQNLSSTLKRIESLLQVENPQQAAQAAREALSILQTLTLAGASPAQRIMVTLFKGEAFFKTSPRSFTTAIIFYRQVLEHVKHVPLDDFWKASLYVHFAASLRELGQFLEGYKAFIEALTIVQGLSGRVQQQFLGEIYWGLSNTLFAHASETMHSQVLQDQYERRTISHREYTVQLASVYPNFFSFMNASADYARHAVAFYEGRQDEYRADLVRTLIALREQAMDNLSQAESILRDIIRRWMGKPNNHMRQNVLSECYMQLANILDDLGRLDAAERTVRIAIRVTPLAVYPLRLAGALVTLGYILEHKGNPNARAAFDQAVQVFEVINRPASAVQVRAARDRYLQRHPDM